MKQKKYRGINRRICLAFIVVTCVIVLAVSSSLIYIFRTIMSNRMIDNQKIFLQQNQTNVQNLVNGFNQIGINLTTDKFIAEMLEKTALPPLELYNCGTELKNQFERYANAPLSNTLSTYYSNLYLFDDYEAARAMEGHELRYDAQNLNSVYSAREIMGEAWAKKVMEKNGQLYTFVLPEQPQTVYMARLIRNINLLPSARNQAIGILVAGLSMTQFKNQVEALALTPHAEVFILNQEAEPPQILYSTNTQSSGGSIIDNEKLREISSFSAGETVRIGREKHLFMKYSTYWGWDIVSLIPLSDVQSEINSLLWVAVVVSALGIVIGSVLIAVISYTVTKPLVNLTNTMRQIRHSGDVTVSLRSVQKHHDEITLLYETFRKMMQRIEQLIREGYESGVQKKEAELLALQAQINPHFIYNTLDSINWLALCNGNDDISEIVSSLADIMRYSIKSPNETVTLRDELTHVENYIKIQSRQSEYPIDITFEIPQEYLGYKMPKFLLEPLVENCVAHGLRNKPESGKVIVRCRREDDLLFLQVSDNGVGADVVLLNQYLVGEIPSLAHSDGFGIKNIDDRIKLHYGSTYGLCFFLNGDKGLTAQIILPCLEKQPPRALQC